MSKRHEFSLIEELTDSIDSKEILLSLIEFKVRFHSLKLFSASEMHGVEDSYSRKRVKDLDEIRNDVIEIIDRCSEAGKKIKIHSTIHIEEIG